MLQITHDAATFLSEIRRSQQVPDTFGLRVFAESTEPGQVSIGLGFTDQPADGDQVSEQEGMRVFVAPEVASPLDDAAIDVKNDDGAAQLVFRPQGDLQN